MKKSYDKLKANLINGDFHLKGECTINLLLMKLDIINIELFMELGRHAIQVKTGRIKSYESTCTKLDKKGMDKTFPNAVDKIHDLIGVRAICYYVDDIYRILEILSSQQDIKIVNVKDYIKNPKPSGYRSLHLIMEIAVSFQGGTQWIRAELQLRTAVMDYWASLDHQLRYKKDKQEAKIIDSELRACADTIGKLDRRMLKIRKMIDKI